MTNALEEEVYQDFLQGRIDEREYDRLVKYAIKEQDFVVRLYEDYKAGKIDKSKYALFLVNILESYMKKIISTNHLTIGAEYDDLMQQGRVAVLSELDRYDPHIARPTTFFTRYIDHDMKDVCEKSGNKMPKHYKTVLLKLEKAARKYGYTGCDDPKLTPDTLATLADVSLMTVLETLRLKSQSTVSWDEMSENTDIVDNGFKTPEKAFIDAERDTFLAKQFSKCSPLEKWLLQNTVLSEEPKSYRTLVKELKKPEIRTFFEGELPAKVEQTFLEQTVNHALRRIKHNPTMRKFVPFEEHAPFAEQASVEDIESALFGNFLDLSET